MVIRHTDNNVCDFIYFQHFLTFLLHLLPLISLSLRVSDTQSYLYDIVCMYIYDNKRERERERERVGEMGLALKRVLQI